MFERGGNTAKPREGPAASWEANPLSSPTRVLALWAGAQVTSETCGSGFLGAPWGALGTRQAQLNLPGGGPHAVVGWKCFPLPRLLPSPRIYRRHKEGEEVSRGGP